MFDYGVLFVCFKINIAFTFKRCFVFCLSVLFKCLFGHDKHQSVFSKCVQKGVFKRR